MNKKSLTIPFVVALVGVLLMIITMFLPYLSATDEMKSLITIAGDSAISSDSSLTANDLLDISMVEYAGMAIGEGESFGGSEEAIICLAVVIVIAVFTLLTALFTLLKKPIVIIVFDVLALLVYLLQGLVFKESGAVGTGAYNFGFGYYVFFAAVAVTLAGAIWLLVVKVSNKKAAKMMQYSQINQ